MNLERILELARQAIVNESYAELKIPFCETLWMLETTQLEKFARLIIQDIKSES